MHEQPAYLRDLAERYRLLAHAMVDPATTRKLRDMATEYEARAQALEAEAPPRHGRH